MTHHYSRTFAVVVAVLLLATTLAPVAGAMPPTPVGPDGPGGDPEPPDTPTATPEPTETPTSTPTPNGGGDGNGTGGSPLGPTAPGADNGSGIMGDLGERVKAGIVGAARELGVNQSLEAAGNVTTAAIELAAYTPHANNAGNWFHNPTNGSWPGLWDLYQDLGKPLAIIALGVGLLMAPAAYASGYISRPEFTKWRRRWVTAIFGYWVWEVGNMYLWILDAIKQGIIAESMAGPELGSLVSTGLVLILIVAVAWQSLAAIGLVLLIIVASIVGVEILMPFLWTLLACRAIPLPFVHKPADKMVRMWAVLPALTLPMVLSLSVGFSVSLSGSSASSGIVSILMPALVFLGSVGFAIVSPYLVWSSMSTTGALSVGFAGGSLAASGTYQKAKESAKSAGSKGRQAARGGRDAVRGARGKAPVADGGRGYDAGRAVRQTGSTARGKRNDGVRSRIRRANARREASRAGSGPGLSRRKQLIDSVRGSKKSDTESDSK